MNHEQALEGLGREIAGEIDGFIHILSAMDEEYRQRLKDSAGKEEQLEKDIRANEERQAQINTEWLEVLKVREDNIKKINEHLFNQTKVCQRMETAYISAPPQSSSNNDLASESIGAICQSIFTEQVSLFLNRS